MPARGCSRSCGIPGIAGLAAIADALATYRRRRYQEPADEALDPEERLLQQHTVARVRAALEQLPADFREVLVLREIEGLSYKEIAEVLSRADGDGDVAARAGARTLDGGAEPDGEPGGLR